MHMKSILGATVALAVSVVIGQASAATLSIAVVGMPGSGQTIWTFSGSAVATGDGEFGDIGGNSTIDLGSQVLDIGDFTGLDLTTRPILSGVATVTVIGAATTSKNIANIFVDDDGAAPDDIGFDFGGPTLGFAAGDTVSFAGSVVAGFDLGELSASLLPFAGTSTQGSGGLGAFLPFSVSISEAPAAIVPLPATLPLALAGLGALGVLARRRR